MLGSVRQRSSNGTEWLVGAEHRPARRPALPTARNLGVAPGMRRHASNIAGPLHRGAVQGSVKAGQV